MNSTNKFIGLITVLITFMCFNTGLSAQTITANSNAQTFTLPVGTNINGLSLWSDASTWQGGVLPSANTDVVIPANSAILLDVLVDVKSINIMGKLIVDPTKDANISAEWIRVMGTGSYMEWGSPSNPYNNKGTLTLKGNDTNATIPGTNNVNYKALLVMGGRLELHGANTKTSWTNLDGTVVPEGSQIHLATVTNWEVGDKIVITTTERFMKETEEKTITSVSADGKTFGLNAPLKYQHFGVVQTYDNGKTGADFQTWNLDERAEVALLDRSIKIQGDTASESLGGFGGHTMYMNNPTIHISNVEFFRMGQTAKLGRYPIHWHLPENQSGDYVKNSSIHHTFNRAITLHGVDNLLIENNVVHESYGHAIFLEDGVEMGNTFHKNLVINTRRPKPADALVPSDNFKDGIRVESPAAFWITNPVNTFTENVAAGSDGVGFWFGFSNYSQAPGKNLPGKGNIRPRTLDLGVFDNNKAHSCHSGLHFDHSHNVNSSGIVSGMENAHFNTGSKTPEVTNYTGYKSFRAWWTRTTGATGINFKRTIVADCIGESNTVSSFEGKTENSLFVGHSDNSPYGTFFESFAVSLYDGQIQVINCHFENYDRPKMSAYVWFDGAVNRTNDFQIKSTYKNSYFFNFNVRSIATQLGSIIHDADGSMIGYKGSIVMEHPFLMSNTENFALVQPPTRGFKSPNHFGVIWLEDKEGNDHPWNTSWGNGHVLHSDENGQNKHQIPVTTSLDRVYTFRPVEKYSNSISLKYQYGKNGDKFDAKFVDSPIALNVSGATKVNSEAAVFSAQSSAWAWVNGTLYLRMVASGDNNTSDNNNIANRSVTITHNNSNSVNVLRRNSTPFDLTKHKENTPISAVKYDYGGDGVAYHEIGIYQNRGNRFSDATYLGDILRLGEVAQMKPNLKGSNGELVNAIHQIKAGEWWKYSVDITQAGTYPLYMLLASNRANNQLTIKVDGVEAFQSTFGNTGGSGTFQQRQLNSLTLSAGTHVITIEANTDNFEFGWLSIGEPTNKNEAPTISVLNATEIKQVAVGNSIQLDVSTTDTDGTIDFVRLYLNGQLIEQKDVAPYLFKNGLLNDLDEGTYVFRVEAIDNGSQSSIEDIIVNVGKGSPALFWNFNDGDQGWTNATRSNVSWVDGVLEVRTTGENDPFVYNTSSPNFISAGITHLKLRIKNKTSANSGQVIIFTSEGNIPINYPMTPNSSNFEDITIDLSTFDKWNNNLSIGNVRLDPNASGESGSVFYDEIRFLKNTDATTDDNIVISWKFDTNDEGWNKNPQRCSTVWNNKGYLDVTTTGENDPSVRNVIQQGFSTTNVNFIELRIKNATADTGGQIIFFTTDGVRSVAIPMTANSTDFETIVVDLSTVNNWSNNLTVTDVRLDANASGATGTISYDYIRLISSQSAVLSVDSEVLKESISVYPNPVRQGEKIVVNLKQLTSDKKIKLYMNDITGKLIYTKAVSGAKLASIPTDRMSAGIYFISIQNNSSLRRFKIIIN